MIQRVQTLFLLLSSIILIIFPFVPILEIFDNNEIYIFGGFGLNHITSKGSLINAEIFPFSIIGIFSILISFLSLTNIFLYNNRKLQLKICRINLISHILLFLIIIFFIYKINLQIQNLKIFDFHLGILLLIFSVISTFMASYYINLDEKLVRSADRLR
ncbi:MAG: DUF4293 domain-containing protein [Bacteroidetes bacterium]|nr:DUF4293 domain-containing protein [Bacteroidota bacterium]